MFLVPFTAVLEGLMVLVGIQDINRTNWSRLYCKVKFHFIVDSILKLFVLKSI